MLNNLDELKETLSRIRRMSPKMFLKTIVNVDFEEWVKQSAEYRGLSYEMAKAVLHDIISEGNSFDTMEEWIDYIGDFQEFWMIVPIILTVYVFLHSMAQKAWNGIMCGSVMLRTKMYHFKDR